MGFPVESLTVGNILKAMEDVWDQEIPLSPTSCASTYTEQETNDPSRVTTSLEGK